MPLQTGAYLGPYEIVAPLGARFDIRAFHDRVLEDGALPMPALGAKIERWIAGAPAARNRSGDLGR